MKKTFFLLIACGLSAIPASTLAQKTTVTRIGREKTYQRKTKEFKVWYQGELNLGFATGHKLRYNEEDEYRNYFAHPFLETIHGVRITRYAFVGLGASAQYILGKMNPSLKDSENWNTWLVPVFFNVKGYYPISEHVAPYLSVSVGNSFCAASNFNKSEYHLYWINYFDSYRYTWEDKLKGGFFGECGIGLYYKLLNFGLGWQHQTLKYESVRDSQKSYNTKKYDSFFIKIGLKF